MAEETGDVKTTKDTVKNSEKSIWRYTTVALMAVVVLLLVAFLWKPGESSVTGNVLSTSPNPNDVAAKAVDFINKNIVQGNSTASLDSVNETDGMLNITVLYQGQKIPVYTTVDGKFLILSAPIDMTQSVPTATPTQQTTTQAAPKTDKPTVQLFVMAFCPYGMQAEGVMKPVFDLLGSKADIQVHFITTVSGTTPDTVQSLHGTVEAQEDLRQACIMKYYDQKTYWNYMTAIDNVCSGQHSDATAYDACWKSAAKNASIDATKIETCANATEGVSLLKADADLSAANGVSGSPTLIINGVVFNGARTPDAYKTGICDAFTTAPSECSQNLSATSTAASGGCAT